MDDTKIASLREHDYNSVRQKVSDSALAANGYAPHVPGHEGDGTQDEHFAEYRPGIGQYRLWQEKLTERRCAEHVPRRDEPRVTERPEELEARRLPGVAPKPIQCEMRAVREPA